MSEPTVEPTATEPVVESPAPAQEQAQTFPTPSVVEEAAAVSEEAETLNKSTEDGSQAQPLPTQASDEDALVADPERDEIEALLATPNGPFELSSGSVVTIRQMNLREFLRLLKIISRGAGASLGNMSLDFNDPDQFVQTLLAMVLFAIPEAEDETVDFIQNMVEPANLSKDSKIALEQRAKLFDELYNPDLEDMINIIGVIVASEGKDLQKLGKRLRSMFSVASKMGLTGNINLK